MTGLRAWTKSHRALALWLLAMALVVKALVPQGYMVVPGKRLTVALCTGLLAALAQDREPDQMRASDIIVTGTLDTAQATAEIERRPGGMATVPDTVINDFRPASCPHTPDGV
jgi:hypothetical protein